MGCIVETVAKFWQFKEENLLNPDIIISLGYGLASPNELPKDEKMVLKKTMEIKELFPLAKIAFASTGHFWYNCKEQEDKLKIEFLTKSGLKNLNDIIMAKEEILNSIDKQGIKPKEIVVIAERMHTRSAYKIYKHFFSETKIVIRNINGVLNDKNPEIHRKSELRWLFANIIRHILFCVFKERIIKMRVKTKLML